jgi:hypothetical protein
MVLHLYTAEILHLGLSLAGFDEHCQQRTCFATSTAFERNTNKLSRRIVASTFTINRRRYRSKLGDKASVDDAELFHNKQLHLIKTNQPGLSYPHWGESEV